MFALLTQYLFKTKELSVPGTGVFTLIPKNASSDFGTRSIQAPGWNVLFTQDNDFQAPVANLDQLYYWLASQLNTSKQEAGLQFDDFCRTLHLQLEEGQGITWEGLGELEKQNNRISFRPLETILTPFTGVTAQKVIRENASHPVLVGERETTTGQMREQLNEQIAGKPRGKKIAWLLLLVALAALGWQIFRNGCNVSSTGNQEKVEISKPQDTYKFR